MVCFEEPSQGQACLKIIDFEGTVDGFLHSMCSLPHMRLKQFHMMGCTALESASFRYIRRMYAARTNAGNHDTELLGNVLDPSYNNTQVQFFLFLGFLNRPLKAKFCLCTNGHV